MAFTTLNFIVFFAIVSVLYYLFPRSLRNYLLLAASYFFYMFSEPAFGLLLLSGTVISYFSARAAERRLLGRHTLWTALGVAYIFVILVFFKYAQFFCSSLFSLIGAVYTPKHNIVLPLGISFYSFAVAGYLFDVHRQNISAEKNFFDYALFVSFFPTLLSGPIGKAREFLPQLKEKRSFSPDNIRQGLLRFAVGAAKKMVLADTLGIFVGAAYSDPSAVSGGALLFAAISYSIQIYIDFSAYSDMAVGSAKILGFTVAENFKAPYLSTSVQSFWKKWHISLTSWFREYLYFPLGGSHCGTVRTLFNVLIVFAISGLWHGSAWTFVIWGLLNGAYQVLGRITKSARTLLRTRLNISRENKFIMLWQGIVTFALITAAWIFFRADTLEQAIYIIKRILLIARDGFGFAGITNIFPKRQLLLAFITLCPCVVEDIRIASGKSFPTPNHSGWRYWMSMLAILLLISICGVYGEGFDPQEFVYFNF